MSHHEEVLALCGFCGKPECEPCRSTGGVKITNRETGLTRDATQEDIDAVEKAEWGGMAPYDKEVVRASIFDANNFCEDNGRRIRNKWVEVLAWAAQKWLEKEDGKA